MNVYVVNLMVAVDAKEHGARGKSSSHLYVVATSFERALEKVKRHYPGADVRGVSLQNYSGLPILIGE
jgi:hypothetical protein